MSPQEENIELPAEETSPMFESNAEANTSFPVEPTTVDTPSSFATASAPSPSEYGMLVNAAITIDNGIVRVSVPSRRGSNNITEVPVPVAAAWLLHCSANPVFESAKALLPE